MTTERDLIQRLANDLEGITEELVIPEYAHTEKERTDASLALVAEARAFLDQPEPEGPPLEPRGCPTPGACSCPTSPTVPPELIRALELAEAALADIGDAEREFGDDLAWAEARAAQDLPRIRIALDRWGRLAQPEPEGPTDQELWDLYQDLGRDFSPTWFARAVLARWGRPTVEPVPVSERLPGPEDCMDEGWVFFR